MLNSKDDTYIKNLEILSAKDFVAGWASGITSTFVGFPLETIKVRQQIMSKSSTASRYFATMLKNEGFRCFFRGISYPMYTTGILNSLYFGFYGNSLRLMENRRGECHYRSCCDGKPVYSGWHLDCFYAGLVGGTASTLVNTPIELTKTILQAHAIKSKSQDILTPTKCLVNLFRTRGLRGCYHGGFIFLIRDVPGFGLYAVFYEHILCMQKNQSENYSSSLIIYEGIAGGCAGVLSWVWAVPADVIKSRYMYDGINGDKNRKYSGIIDCVVKTYRENGLKTFSNGLGIILLRAFPVNFICFVSYEKTLRLLNKYF